MISVIHILYASVIQILYAMNGWKDWTETKKTHTLLECNKACLCWEREVGGSKSQNGLPMFHFHFAAFWIPLRHWLTCYYARHRRLTRRVVVGLTLVTQNGSYHVLHRRGNDETQDSFWKRTSWLWVRVWVRVELYKRQHSWTNNFTWGGGKRNWWQ